jgi:hypothetical protein
MPIINRRPCLLLSLVLASLSILLTQMTTIPSISKTAHQPWKFATVPNATVTPNISMDHEPYNLDMLFTLRQNNTFLDLKVDHPPAMLPIQLESVAQGQTNFHNVGGCLRQIRHDERVAVIMVHIGSLEHSRHSLLSMSQLRQRNPSVRIVWLLNKDTATDPEVAAVAECYNAEVVYIEELEANSTDLTTFRRVFFVSGNMNVLGNPEEFNFRTSARIVYVLAYMKATGLRRVFHVENDNLIYVPLHNLADAIDACQGQSVACGRRSDTELALGFMYIADHTVLQPLVDFWIKCYSMGKPGLQQLFLQHMNLHTYEWVNDMSLSNLYNAMNPQRPIQLMPSGSSTPTTFEKCVFDAARHIMDIGNLAIWHFGDFQVSLSLMKFDVHVL